MRARTLKSASEAGDLDAVQHHLARGAEINTTSAAGHFALGGAIVNGHTHIVEYLIGHGANIDQRTEFGWSPLYMAAWKGRAEITALLLLAGAKTNTRTRAGWNSPSGYSPLHIGAEGGSLAVVMLLVAAGARLDARTESSQTALDLATVFGHDSVARYLKNCAADVTMSRSIPRPERAIDGVTSRSSIRGAFR